MAFTSLTALPLTCGSEGSRAGIDKLYVIAHKDLDDTTGEVYTTATNGLVNAINLDAGKKFVEIGILPNTVDVVESAKVDITKASYYYEQTVKLVLADITLENGAFIDSVARQAVAVIYKTRNGKYYVAGLNGRLILSALESTTGTADGDLVGSNLTFTGVDSKRIGLVDETIVSDLI